jgi:hypothetical protein
MVSIVYVCAEMVMPVHEMCFRGKELVFYYFRFISFFLRICRRTVYFVLEGKCVYNTINHILGIFTGSYRS